MQNGLIESFNAWVPEAAGRLGVGPHPGRMPRATLVWQLRRGPPGSSSAGVSTTTRPGPTPRCACRRQRDRCRSPARATAASGWRTVDVVDSGGQFCDRGPSYRTAIFVAGDEERAVAEASKAAAEAALGRTIVTPILDATAFWPAEDYHQDYYLVSSFRYTGYRFACGRDRRVKQLWGDQAYQGLAKD